MAARDAALRWFGNVAGARPLHPLALPRVGCRRRRVETPAFRAVELDRAADNSGEHRRGGRRKTRLFRVRGGGRGDLAGAVVAARLDLDDAAPRLSRRVARALQRLSGAYLPRLVPERDERRGAFLLPLQHAPFSRAFALPGSRGPRPRGRALAGGEAGAGGRTSGTRHHPLGTPWLRLPSALRPRHAAATRPQPRRQCEALSWRWRPPGIVADRRQFQRRC